MLGKISLANLSRSGYNSQTRLEDIPALDNNYTTLESRAKTVAACGSSRTTSQILPDMISAKPLIREMIQSGRNVAHGGGLDGFMKVYLDTACEFSKVNPDDGRPMQSLVIAMNPPYHNETIKRCTLVGVATSEEDRVAKFSQISDHFLIEKGSVATLQEATAVIAEGKNTVLVGRKFWDGLITQCSRFFKDGFAGFSFDETVKVAENSDINDVLDKVDISARRTSHGKFVFPVAIRDCSNSYIVYNGGMETIKHATSLVQQNEYSKGKCLKPVLFVGDFFEGLKKQYQAICDAGFLRHKPEELFRFISVPEALKKGRLL